MDDKTAIFVPKKKPLKNNRNETRGRRTTYHPKWTPLTVKALLQSGKTMTYAAAQLGISLKTLVEWSRKYPELKEAIKEGRKPVDEKVISSLYKCATGYVYEEIVYGEKKYSEAELKRRAKMRNPPLPEYVPVGKKFHYVKPKIDAIKFWLINRCPNEWREKHDYDIQGKMEYTVIPIRPQNALPANQKEEEINGETDIQITPKSP